MKELLVAKSAGFCFGVRRSMEMAEALITDTDEPCYCLGPLIHNRDAADYLANKGLRTVDAPEKLPQGARVLIRSHGVGREVYAALEAKGARIEDATCPKVARIHQIAQRSAEEGRTVLIIGAEEHPEVLGIRGWCDDCLVFDGAAALQSWLEEDPSRGEKPLTAVFQTTQTAKTLANSQAVLKKECTNCQVFDTICGATSSRQEEAMTLAKTCDAMVVIGGRHSANSLHLYELCRGLCPNVQFIENASELDINAVLDEDRVGIAAGASTPAWIIKEVVEIMCDEINGAIIDAEQAVEATAAESVGAMESEAPVFESVEADLVPEEIPEAEKTFDQMLEDSIRTIYTGDTVTGIVAAVTPTEVTVDLGIKHSGYIPLSEFEGDPDFNPEDIKIGCTIKAIVVRVNDIEGTAMLSKKRLDAVKSWKDIEAAQEDGTTVEGTVTEENKGGVVVSVRGIRVFVPASQTGLAKDSPMSELLGTKVRLKITEVNRGRRRVVGSIRAVQFKERKERSEKIWSDIEVGKKYDGVVKSLTSYGAFVDIGGIDGMVHVSELSWNRTRHPSDILSVGDKISVHVLSFDRENRKISLGCKSAEDNPWAKFLATYQVGDVVSVKIVKLMPFGAFAEVLPGVDGLIHISQIANRRIGKPDEVLEVGQTVDAKITAVDNDKQKISLSIRALSEPAPAPAREAEEESYEPGPDSALVYEVSETGQATGLAPNEEAPQE